MAKRLSGPETATTVSSHFYLCGGSIMTIGIYKLNFKNTFYIGQSLNIEKRISNHIWMLKSNRHPNKYMQEEYNNTLILPNVEILIECSSKELSDLESYYIEKYNAKYLGSNILNSNITVLHGDNHPACKYTNNTIISIFLDIVKNEISLKNIAEKYLVNKSLVYSIAKGENHCWLRELYPKEYLLMKEARRNGRTAKEQGIIYPKIMSPNGTIYDVYNLQEFSRTHGLSNSSLHQVLTGKRKTVSKWRLAA